MTATNDDSLHGLVLLGGESVRMGMEKARIQFDGMMQCERAATLLATFCTQVYLSTRPGREIPDPVAQLPVLYDSEMCAGPASGVLAAFGAQPDRAWLVLACDLPLMDTDSVRALVTGRDRSRCATAFMASDGLLEPASAVYEPRCASLLHRQVSAGNASLRDFLMHSRCRLLAPPDDECLFNMNDIEDVPRARELLEAQKLRLKAGIG